jgi:DNA-binding transcriptional MerR regulator
MDTTHYNIQQMAQMSGLSAHTLRYYERIGLLPATARRASGHRMYSEADWVRLQFLLKLKATGMPIQQMITFNQLYEQGDSTIPQRRQMLAAQKVIVQQQIEAMQNSLCFIELKIARYYEVEASTEGAALLAAPM